VTNKQPQSNKGKLHPRNKHTGQYDFESLIKACPELAPLVITNPKGALSINFSDAQSVLLLNKALLAYFYQISFWQIPQGYLCHLYPVVVSICIILLIYLLIALMGIYRRVVMLKG
jgi:23S rRNA (adenine1618-N6)-methyltransferase